MGEEELKKNLLFSSYADYSNKIDTTHTSMFLLNSLTRGALHHSAPGSQGQNFCHSFWHCLSPLYIFCSRNLVVSLSPWLSKSDVCPCYGLVEKWVDAGTNVPNMPSDTGKWIQKCSPDTQVPGHLFFFHSVFTVKFFFIRYVDYLAGKCYTGMQEESVIRIFDAVCFMCNSAISAKAA